MNTGISIRSTNTLTTYLSALLGGFLNARDVEVIWMVLSYVWTPIRRIWTTYQEDRLARLIVQSRRAYVQSPRLTFPVSSVPTPEPRSTTTPVESEFVYSTLVIDCAYVHEQEIVFSMWVHEEQDSVDPQATIVDGIILQIGLTTTTEHGMPSPLDVKRVLDQVLMASILDEQKPTSPTPLLCIPESLSTLTYKELQKLAKELKSLGHNVKASGKRDDLEARVKAILTSR